MAACYPRGGQSDWSPSWRTWPWEPLAARPTEGQGAIVVFASDKASAGRAHSAGDMALRLEMRPAHQIDTYGDARPMTVM